MWEACGDKSTAVWLRSVAHNTVSFTFNQQQWTTFEALVIAAHAGKNHSPPPPQNQSSYWAGIYSFSVLWPAMVYIWVAKKNTDLLVDFLSWLLSFLLQDCVPCPCLCQKYDTDKTKLLGFVMSPWGTANNDLYNNKATRNTKQWQAQQVWKAPDVQF